MSTTTEPTPAAMRAAKAARLAPSIDAAARIIDAETRAEVDRLREFVTECVSVFAQFTNRGGRKGGLANKMCDKAHALRDGRA